MKKKNELNMSDDFVKLLRDSIFKNTRKKSPARRKVEIENFLEKLKELWMTCPEQRFAQILYNYTSMGTLISPTDPSLGLKDFFYYEDSSILSDIIKNKKNNIKRKSKIKPKS